MYDPAPGGRQRRMLHGTVIDLVVLVLGALLSPLIINLSLRSGSAAHVPTLTTALILFLCSVAIVASGEIRRRRAARVDAFARHVLHQNRTLLAEIDADIAPLGSESVGRRRGDAPE